MTELFLKLVNMSLGASLLIIAILILRPIMKKAPRRTVCLLWAFVAVRLVLPISLESPFSLIPNRELIPADIIYAETSVKVSDASIIPPYGAVEGGYPVTVTDTETVRLLPLIFTYVWVVGAAVMLAYAAVSYIALKRRVSAAVKLCGNIKQCERVSSPFVLGIIRPTVYLPFDITEADAEQVIAHEKAHIKRGDHLWKPMGFLFLAVYWFNPLLWAAYILLCRDIESACDEAVIDGMDSDGRRAYSAALFNCAVHRRSIAACPLAFGETGVKSRIKGVMNYKKPAFWVSVVAVIACIVVAVCFLTDPKEDTKHNERNAGKALETTQTAPPIVEYDGSVTPTIPNTAEKMTLEKVIALSKKGYALTEDDIGGYAFVETGSGLYIRHFDIDSNFYLLVGGFIGDSGFNYVRLYCIDDKEYTDIRDGGAEAFIAGHTHSDEYARLLLFDRYPLSGLIDYAFSEASITAAERSIDIKKEYVNVFHDGDGNPVEIVFFAKDPKLSGSGYVRVTLVMDEGGSYIIDPSLTVTDGK